ncbi:MAG: flagellar basal body-associated protein FliL [Alphaproteobacteria bacterium]|nr:flagellar basal body-associated protein FliL [Alphaproteobacteria bacterium]
MKKLLPVILAVVGLAIGTGAGMFLKPKPLKPSNDPATKSTETASSGKNATAESKPSLNGKAPASEQPAPEKPAIRRSQTKDANVGEGFEYVKLNNQFVVPVVTGAKVTALVVMSLSIEVKVGGKEIVFGREPKLRDAFLQVLFNHANSGGFNGTFTTGEKMNDLRGSLFEVASRILGPIATDVLVIDIVRQDVQNP